MYWTPSWRILKLLNPVLWLQIKEGADAFSPGQQLQVAEMFKEGDLVDVSGKSIGKGFQGAR